MLDLTQFDGHTPGAWRSGAVTKSISRNIDLWVSDVDSPDFLVAADVRGVGQAECKANARLIAAAPALLAEVKRLREALRNILVETNFISLDAARDYVQEVLDSQREGGAK